MSLVDLPAIRRLTGPFELCVNLITMLGCDMDTEMRKLACGLCSPALELSAVGRLGDIADHVVCHMAVLMAHCVVQFFYVDRQLSVRSGHL